MSFWRKLKFLLPFYRRAKERDMQEELDSLTAIAGQRELGNLTLAAENARAEWGWGWLSCFGGDLRYAFRVLRKRPSFTLVAIFSLALGIGANAAIFSLIDSLLIRSLPVRDPERLVSFEGASGSYFGLRQFQANSRDVLEGVIAATGVEERDLSAGGEPRQGYVELVSGNYFEVLGVRAALGRMITEADDRRNTAGLAAVISYGYWQRAFGGDPAILGHGLRIQKIPFTIVGVAPPEFLGVRVGQAPDVWLPLTTHDQVFSSRGWLDKPQTNFLALMGRRSP